MVASVLTLDKEKKELLWRTLRSLPWTMAGSSRTPTRLLPLSQSSCPNGSSGLAGFAVYSLQNIQPIPCLSLFPQQVAALRLPHAPNIKSDRDSSSLTGNRILPLQS